MEIKWEDGAEIRFTPQREGALLSANRAGLLSLAGLLHSLADGTKGGHVHLDAYNAFEDGSAELIIEKID